MTRTGGNRVKRSKYMSRIWLLAFAAGVLAGAFAAAAVQAGTVLDVKTVYFDEQKTDETATIYLDLDRARFDASEGGRRIVLIARRNAKGEPICWVIDTEKKSYVEIDRKSVAEIQSQMERARLMFEQQIATAPPESRERVRQALEAQYGSVMKKKPVVEYKKLATGVTIKKWHCTQYEAYVDGAKFEDVWAASEKDLGLAASGLQVLSEMGELFSGMSPKTNAFFQVGRATGGYAGFPVVVVEYRGAAKQEKSEVTGVRQEKLDPALFELPQGFAKQKLTQ
jgi:hypothetical protein